MARILARFSASQAVSSMAAVAAAIDSASQLYESFTFRKPAMICGCAIKNPKPQPGQPVRLAQRPRDHQAFALRHKRHAIRLGKIGVGLVDQQRAGGTLGQFEQSRRGDQRAGWTIWIRHDRQFQTRDRLDEAIRQGPVFLERNFFVPGALDLGQCLVEDVAGIGKADQLSLPDQCPRQDRQDLVAAVAAEDPIRLNAIKLAAALAKRVGQRIRIAGQSPFERRRGSPAPRPAKAGMDSRWCSA